MPGGVFSTEDMYCPILRWNVAMVVCSITGGVESGMRGLGVEKRVLERAQEASRSGQH
jgi:hypothetical protein